jgi:hypothetical protein
LFEDALSDASPSNGGANCCVATSRVGASRTCKYIRHDGKVWHGRNVMLVEMSGINSRRELRLRLEGCSTGEESEDESQVSLNLSDTLAFSVIFREFRPSIRVFCLPLSVYISGYENARGRRALR